MDTGAVQVILRCGGEFDLRAVVDIRDPEAAEFDSGDFEGDLIEGGFAVPTAADVDFERPASAPVKDNRSGVGVVRRHAEIQQ